MTQIERQQYESQYRSAEDNAIQDFIKFVDYRENLFKNIDYSKSIFSESPEAELAKQAKVRRAELHGGAEESDAQRAVNQLKEFQKEAMGADEVKLKSMLQTLSFSVSAIDNSIYQSELQDKDNKPGIKKRLEELHEQLPELAKNPEQLEKFRQKVRDVSAEINRVYHKAKTEGVVIDFKDVPDVNQQKILKFQEELKDADAKALHNVATHIMTYADLARSQFPKDFEEKKLDEKMTEIVKKLNNLDTPGQATPENINVIKEELDYLAEDIKPLFARIHHEAKVRPETPANIYEFCNIIIDNEGKDSNYRPGGEYELVNEEGKFQPHNFLMWVRSKMEEARQNDPDNVISLYTGVTLVRDVQGGVRTIKLVDIFLEHTLLRDRVEKPVEVIDENGQKTTKIVVENEMTPEMTALQDYIGVELFCLHTSHNADAKYRRVMAEEDKILEVLNEMYHWNVFTNKNRFITLWHGPSGTKEETERMMKGEKFEGSFGRELQRFMRAYFYLPQVGAVTELEAKELIQKKRQELEKENEKKKAKGEKPWTKSEMDAIAYGAVPYLIKDEVEYREVVENGKKKTKKIRKVGTAVNKFEESLGEKGTKAFYERVSAHIIQDKLGGQVEWGKLVKEEKEKKTPNPEIAALRKLSSDPQAFIHKIGEKNEKYKLTPEDIAIFQTNPKKFTEIILQKIMGAAKPDDPDKRGGLAALNLFSTPKINWTIWQGVRNGFMAAAAAQDQDLIQAGRLRERDVFYAESMAMSMNYWLMTAAYGDTEGVGFDYASRWTRPLDYRIKLRSGVGELDTIPAFKMIVVPSLMGFVIRDKNQKQMSILTALDKVWDKDPKKRQSLLDYNFDLNVQRQYWPDQLEVGANIYQHLTTKDGMQLDKLLSLDPYTGRTLYRQSELTSAIRKGPEKWFRYLTDTSNIRLNDVMSGASHKVPRVDEKGNIFYATEFETMELKRLMFGDEVFRMNMYDREPFKGEKGKRFARNPYAYLVAKELWEFSYRNKRSHKRYFTAEHMLAIKQLFQNIPVEVRPEFTEDGLLILKNSSPFFTDEEWDQITDIACMSFESLVRRALLQQVGRGLGLGLWKFFLKFMGSLFQ